MRQRRKRSLNTSCGFDFSNKTALLTAVASLEMFEDIDLQVALLLEVS